MEKITFEIFGQRLSLLMADFGVTETALADAIGIAQSAVNNYKHGKRIPPLEEAVKIAKYFQVSVDFMLGWEGKKEQLSPLFEAAAMFAERFGESPEEQQKFFNEYVSLLHETRLAAKTLTDKLDDLELKTRFLVIRKAQSKKSSSAKEDAAKIALSVHEEILRKKASKQSP